jgi:hypothetical protein
MDLVHTIRGDLPRHELTYRDIVTEDDVCVQTAREWFHNGEMVRRDAWVDIKRGLSSEAQLNGL